MNGRDGLVIIAFAVEFGHTHATQTYRRDLQPGLA